MKIWHQYGSEHSANLVMIGRFKNVTEATKAKEIIEEVKVQVSAAEANGTIVADTPSERYSDVMLDLLRRLHVHSISPAELEQFLYEVHVGVEGSSVVLTTEEIEVSAFFKVLFNQGARIEVFSRHHYPDT